MNDFRKALSRIVIIVLLAGIIVTSGVAGSTLLKNHSLVIQTTSQSSSSHSSTTSTGTPTGTATTSATSAVTTSTSITSPNVGAQNGEHGVQML